MYVILGFGVGFYIWVIDRVRLTIGQGALYVIQELNYLYLEK